MAAKVAVAEPGDRMLATDDDLEEALIGFGEEVEALVGPTLLDKGFRHLVEDAGSRGWVVDLGDEFKVAAVGCEEDLAKVAKAVNGFLERGKLINSGAVTLFHLPVVLEEGD